MLFSCRSSSCVSQSREQSGAVRSLPRARGARNRATPHSLACAHHTTRVSRSGHILVLHGVMEWRALRPLPVLSSQLYEGGGGRSVVSRTKAAVADPSSPAGTAATAPLAGRRP